MSDGEITLYGIRNLGAVAVLAVATVLATVILGPLVYFGAQALGFSVVLGDLLGDVLFACIAIGAAIYVFVLEE